MRYSHLHTKTQKTMKDFDSVNAKYLIQGAFIDQVMAGAYTYLPLGVRVLRKIEQIIRDEMDTIGTEILMPAVVPTSLWETTGRIKYVDVLTRVSAANDISKSKNGSEYILSPTHEEVVTPLAMKFARSYRDLPCAYYQIQTKFRNEARPKSGLLRGREFRMKDLYSFHADAADLKAYYERSKDSYWRVYERLGLKDVTYIAAASGGDFTDDYSHEFQVRVESGEDLLFHVPTQSLTYNREIAPARAPAYDQQGEVVAEREDVAGEGMIGVQALCDYLKIPVQKTTKTLIYQADDRVIAVAVRGDYDINELKVKRIVQCKSLSLATAETVRRVTGAEVGYAGLLGLPPEVEVYMDDSMEGRVNFEMGANQTHYHSINVNFGRDLALPHQFYDLKLAEVGDLYPETGEVYETFRACEVGNIFPLYTKFSDAFGYTYQDASGTQQPVYMGCYGIGPSRIMGVLVEKYHDDRGIIWPESVAPYKYHLVGLDLHDEAVRSRVESVYETLKAKYGDEVLYDDRVEARAGEKFADADLIGCPIRLVVSRKTDTKVEMKRRHERESTLVEIDAL